MKFSLILLLIYFPSFLFADQIKFDHIFDGELVSKDPVKERRWVTGSDVLIEQEDRPEGFSISFKKVSELGIEEIRRIDSNELLDGFRKLPGFSTLKWQDLTTPEISSGAGMLLFYLANDYFVCKLHEETYEINILRVTHSPYQKHGASFSPDEKFLSYLENENIHILDLESLHARQVTFEGDKDHLFGQLDWVYQEEIYGRGNYKGYWWSPDSQTLAFLKIDETPVRPFPLVDHSKLYGELSYSSYPKAGTPNPVVSIGFVSARGGPVSWVYLSKYELSQYLVVGVGFTPDSENLVFQIQDRKQSWLDLNIFHLSDKVFQTVLRESSDDWVNRLQEEPKWHDSGFYWLSQRTGYTHIYSYHLDESFHVSDVQAITEGDWDVKNIIYTDREKIYFDSNQHSSLENHIYRLGLEDYSTIRLTSENSNHEGIFNHNGNLLILSTDSISSPKHKSLFKIDKKSLSKITNLFIPNTEKLDALDLANPSFLKVKASDDVELNAMLIKPTNFDPLKKYPVVSYTYSGPSAPSVQNRFGSRNYLWHQYLASKGYVIWICDNRSASGIGHLSEASSYKQLGVGELKDLEDGISYLKQFNWVDDDRIGLWGWSFGGYMTVFALTHSDTFKLGISVAPVVDWELYDSIYTERYMSTPQENPEGYKRSSALKQAKNLSGNFLLIHGIMDDNVHYQNSVQLSSIIQEENIDFEQMYYGKSRHGMNKKMHPHLYRKMEKFIQSNL